MSDQLRCTTCGHYAVACEDEYKALKAELEDTEEAHGDDNHHLGVALIRIEALEADNAALKAELISTQEAWAEVRKGEMEAVTKLMFYEAERDALKADAERYRWLRVHSTGPSEGWSTHVNPESLDAVVDAAISAAKGKGK